MQVHAPPSRVTSRVRRPSRHSVTIDTRMCVMYSRSPDRSRGHDARRMAPNVGAVRALACFAHRAVCFFCPLFRSSSSSSSSRRHRCHGRRRRARVVVTRATVRDVRDSTRWDTRKRSHRATASAVSAVRAHTRDWCVRDRATDGRARDLDYSSSRMTACSRSRASATRASATCVAR